MPCPEGFDMKDKSNPRIFFRLLLLEILYGGEIFKNEDFRRDCRKSPNVAVLENSHVVKSVTYVFPKT